MLESISWKDFVLWAGLAGSAYYGFLLFTGKFNLKRTNSSSSGERLAKRKWAIDEEQNIDQEEEPAEIEEASEYHATNDEERNLDALEGLADDLQKIITDHEPVTDKASLMAKLQQEVARYPALNRPAFKGAITNLIIRATLAECDIEVTREEADALWSHF